MIVNKDNNQVRQWLLQCYQAGLSAVSGDTLVCQALSEFAAPKLRLIAIGKAAGAMAAGAFAAASDRIVDALVISKSGHLDALPHDDRITALEAGHPVPTVASLEGGTLLVERLSSGGTEDQWLMLLSGGASSLVEVLPDGYGIDDLQRLNQWLLASGLDIKSMNAIRQRVSLIKGGGANRYLQGKADVWAISDVPLDDLAVIGSGLFYESIPLSEKPELPDWIQDWMLQTGQQMPVHMHDKPPHRVLGNLDRLLEAVATAARESAEHVRLEPVHFSGEAEQLGRQLAKFVIDGAPGLSIWGGESTVRLPADPGTGGRSQQLALAAATELAGREDCYLLAIGSDGTDGPTDAAGALVDGGTVQRARQEGYDVEQALREANAYPCLAETGDLIVTGPTGTNVTDVVLGFKVAK